MLLLFLPFAHAAVSEEQVQSVGGSSLTDAMPNSARQYLDGVSPENADTLSNSVSRVLENMTSDSQSAIRTALGGLLRVAVIVLLASAARGFSAAAGGGVLKEVVRTAAGLLMLLALLQPLAGLHVLSWNWQGSVSQSDIDEMQARNMQTTMSTVAASIAKAVQQRAEEAGIPCTVNVEMANDADGLLQVDKVTVYYDSTSANRLSELQSLLTKECGVPAERQELIAR